MKNDAYWANRMRILEDALLDTGYEYVQNLERQYDKAIRDIETDIAHWYQRFAKNNEISLNDARKLLNSQELEEFKWTVEEYIKYGKENAVNGAWIKQLENASARVHISRLEAIKLQLQQQAEVLAAKQTEAVKGVSEGVYRSSYYHTAFELQKGVGVGWTLHAIDENVIEKVLSRPWTLDKQTFSDRIWANKQALVNTVNTQITQMVMRGAAPDNTIKAIADRFKVSKSQAGRLVMTESAAFANEARKDCFKDLDVEKYVIVETLDGKTCSLCAQLDGKVYPMSEYAIGVTAPPFHPWCRGTTAPYFDDMDDIAERWARDPETGKTYTVPGNMTYKQWAERQVQAKAAQYKDDDAAALKFLGGSAKDDLKSIVKRRTIKLENGFSCFSDDDVLTEYVKNVKPLKTYFDVALHGAPNAVGFGSTEMNMSARMLASVIRHSIGWNGQKIRLLSCSTGKQTGDNYCFAEELANALGVEVKAPNDLLYIYPSGRLKVGARGEGHMLSFLPNQRKRKK